MNINELKKGIEELQSNLRTFKESEADYNNKIEIEKQKLMEYMKQNKYDNVTIGKYTNINDLFELTTEQNNIKDISILRQIIRILRIKELRGNNKELISMYNNSLSKKQDQLRECNLYGRIFTA